MDRRVVHHLMSLVVAAAARAGSIHTVTRCWVCQVRLFPIRSAGAQRRLGPPLGGSGSFGLHQFLTFFCKARSASLPKPRSVNVAGMGVGRVLREMLERLVPRQQLSSSLSKHQNQLTVVERLGLVNARKSLCWPWITC